jgi:hypothetical protein
MSPEDRTKYLEVAKKLDSMKDRPKTRAAMFQTLGSLDTPSDLVKYKAELKRLERAYNSTASVSPEPQTTSESICCERT